MQHVVLVYPWHGGVRPGLLPSGRHVSCDGVQVDMLFFDLSNVGECGRARQPLRVKGDNPLRVAYPTLFRGLSPFSKPSTSAYAIVTISLLPFSSDGPQLSPLGWVQRSAGSGMSLTTLT